MFRSFASLPEIDDRLFQVATILSRHQLQVPFLPVDKAFAALFPGLVILPSNAMAPARPSTQVIGDAIMARFSSHQAAVSAPRALSAPETAYPENPTSH